MLQEFRGEQDQHVPEEPEDASGRRQGSFWFWRVGGRRDRGSNNCSLKFLDKSTRLPPSKGWEEVGEKNNGPKSPTLGLKLNSVMSWLWVLGLVASVLCIPHFSFLKPGDWHQGLFQFLKEPTNVWPVLREGQGLPSQGSHHKWGTRALRREAQLKESHKASTGDEEPAAGKEERRHCFPLGFLDKT